MKRRFLFIVIVLILAACAAPTPVATPTLQPLPTATQTRTATATLTPSPTSTNTPISTLIPTVILNPTPTIPPLSISFALPEECKQRNPKNDEFLYELMGYGKTDACKLFTTSPDKFIAAYVTIEQRFPNATIEADVVKVIYINDKTGFEIHRNWAWKISNLEWSSNGKLIISDISPENTGRVAIYDTKDRKITNLINGRINFWNPQRNAFYTTFNYFGDGGLRLSGYDAISDQVFPVLQTKNLPIDKQASIFEFIDSPIWVSNGRALLLNVRAVNLCPFQDRKEGPFSIEEIDLSGSKPTQITIKSSIDTDYFISSFDEKTGMFSIKSSPYQMRSCK